MPYIKSHSNYILKKRHQNVNGGTIYERDITTIGGRDNFSKGQVPLYQSGNFVITVNNDDNVQKSIYSDGWEQNEEGEIWTLDNIEGIIKDETASEDEKIVLKQDYYNLRDFAYFGSCSELVRASVSDILKKYPGELFIPYDGTIVSAYTYDDTQIILNDDGTTSEEVIHGLTGETTDLNEIENYISNYNGNIISTYKLGGIPVFYYDYSNFNGGSEEATNLDENGNSKTIIKRLGGDNKFLVDNPFNINIHTTILKDKEITSNNFLKYFGDNGYKNYELIDTNGDVYDFDWEVNNFIIGVDENGKNIYAGKDIQFDVNPSASTIVNSDGGKKIISTTVTSETEDDGSHHYCLGKEIAEIKITVKQKRTNFNVTPENNVSKSSGQTLNLNVDSELLLSDKESFTIEAWLGNNDKVYYLIDLEENHNLITNIAKNKSAFKYRIRPKVEYVDDFINKLDMFEKVLMNRDSSPIYTATFNVIRENEYGYYNELERLTFPTTYGGYNIGSDGSAFDEYVSKLADIAEFYDERFCDNMYRSMTHEAIKNFDWTYMHVKNIEGEEDEIRQGEDKVAKIIRLFGRQFDEILAYIDNIKNYNVVTYNNINNLPDYFFTDDLENDGWDIKQIMPFTLSEYVGESKFSDDVSSLTSEEDEKKNEYNNLKLHRIFTPNTNEKVKPYDKKYDAYGDGYFFGCKCMDVEKEFTIEPSESEELVGDEVITTTDITSFGQDVKSKHYSYFDSEGDSQFSMTPSESDDFVADETIVNLNITSFNDKIIESDTFVDCKGELRNRIKNYSSDNEWTLPKVNNEFMKRLIINSKSIWNHKGTQDSVEMILAMFGMKSKRWYDSLPKYEADSYNFYFKDNLYAKPYDYEIKEYTSFTKRIEDTYIEHIGDYKFDWFNKAKNISYNNDEYIPYQGLPVTYRNSNGKRYLYPNFQKNEKYDGKPYYQMNGGWLSTTPYIFDKDDNLVVQENSKIYNETLRNIKSVNSLSDLFELPSQDLNNGDIVHVNNLSGNFAVVDGNVYPLEEEFDGKNTYRYFTVEVKDSFVVIGRKYFDNYVVVSDPYMIDSKRRYNLIDGECDNMKIKIYLIKRENIKGETIYAYSDEVSVSTFTVFQNGKYMEGDGFTNYFRINDKSTINELSPLGWQQLKENDNDFYKVNSKKDYYKGNNPHTGHLHYDNGHEYFTYFRHLFRYAYRNSLFEDSVLSEYENYYNKDSYNEIYDFGFKGLINDDSCQLDYEDFLTEDSKIHYFGNYYNENGVKHYVLDENTLDNEYNLSSINPKAIKIKPVSNNAIGYGWMYKSCNENNVEGKVPIDGVTNQIVNNKLIKIIFYLRDNNFYSKTALEEIKYIESVVIPYMTQLIPSGAILGTEFRYIGQNVHSYTVKTVVNGEPIDGIKVQYFNDETQEWDDVGYTEQGVLTFEKDGNYDMVKVRINDANSEEYSLELSNYYISSDYVQNEFDIDVKTNYQKISFNNLEGEIKSDGCLEFSGDTSINKTVNNYTYEIVYQNIERDGNNWIDFDEDVYNNTLTNNGGKISLGLSENNTLYDRDAKIIIKYKPTDSSKELSKEILIHQYGNNEYVTYTVLSNVSDGVDVLFINKDTEKVEKKVSIINGLAEYSKPKVLAKDMTVKIIGGLPLKTSKYVLKTTDDSRSVVVNNTGETNWSAPLFYKKYIDGYTWDDAVKLEDRVEIDTSLFTIKPNETIEKNYNPLPTTEAPASEVNCMVEKPKVLWAEVSNYDVNGTHFLNIKPNTNNHNRELVLTYYIKEDPSVLLKYKIIQNESVYEFKFVTIPNNVDNTYSIKDAPISKKATITTDYTKHTYKFPLKYIDSHGSNSDIKVPFIISTNNGDVTYSIDGEYLHLNLPKNTCTEENSFDITLIQRYSNKRIILTVKQEAVTCNVGDVYFYNPLSGKYYFVDVLSDDKIDNIWSPIGITIMPMDNGLTGNTNNFARLISLTEKNNDEYNNPYWRKSDSGDAQRKDYRWRVGCIEDQFQSWVASLGTETYKGNGVFKYQYRHENNGLYYAKTKKHIDKIMYKDQKGHYKVNKIFANDELLYRKKYKYYSCLGDFNGFEKTREAVAQTKNIGAMYKMCDNYTTSGTKEGQWYVGGAGEMACLVQNIGLINDVIDKLIELNYNVDKLHYQYRSNDSAFNSDHDNGQNYKDYYWTITNKGLVDDFNDEESPDPYDGDEYSSWIILLTNGAIQWAVHRAGFNESRPKNQVRARVRPMLLVDRNNNHSYN